MRSDRMDDEETGHDKKDSRKERNRRDRPRSKDRSRDRRRDDDRAERKGGRNRDRRRSRDRDRRRDSRSRSRGRRSYYRRRDRRSRSRDRRRRRRSPSSSSSNSSSSEDQAKQNTTGFTIVPRVNVPMAPTGLTAGTSNQDIINATIGQGLMQMGGANLQLTRQARRLYVGNLPVQLGLTEPLLLEFFTNAVISLGVITPNPILSVWISSEMTFCFVEFRSIADATACLTLMQGIALGGRTLRVGRPADYTALSPAYDNFIVGFPPGTYKPPSTDKKPSDIGALTAGNLLGLQPTPASSTSTPAGGSTTTQESKEAKAIKTAIAQTKIDIHSVAHSDKPTKVLHLLDMVKASELEDDNEYLDILEDVKEECSKHGTVGQVIIPRPTQPYPGQLIGTILVLYASTEQTQKAKEALDGMTFSQNRVRAAYYDEVKFVDILAVSMALDISEVKQQEAEGNKNTLEPEKNAEIVEGEEALNAKSAVDDAPDELD